jgi:hypothetical protein
MTAETVSRPTSPSCLEPALPIQTTLQRTELSGSWSKMISTACLRLRRKLPRSRKPSFEESRTRQGSLFWLRSRLMTRLASLRQHPLRAAALGDRKAGHFFTHWATRSDGTRGLVSFEVWNDEPLLDCTLWSCCTHGTLISWGRRCGRRQKGRPVRFAHSIAAAGRQLAKAIGVSEERR